MDLDFAKTLYFRELDRRAQLDGAPTPRVAILGIVGGVFTFYAERLRWSEGPMTWLFLACAAGAVLFSVLSIVWIIRSYADSSWKSLGVPDELSSFYQALVALSEQPGNDSVDPDRLFERKLLQQLIGATSYNTLVNNRRAELIFRANVFLSMAVVLALAAGLPLLSAALNAVLHP